MSLLAVTISFTFRDQKGKSSTTDIKVPVGFTIPEYIDAAQRLATVLVNNTLALLTQVEVCLGLNVTPPATVPLANSDVQEKAQFVFNAANNLNYVMQIPTLDESVLVAGSDLIDQTNVGVAAMITLMEDGDGTIVPVNNRDQDIVSIDYARELFRRR